MKKITKSYLEKIYDGVVFSESSLTEVTEKDPMKVKNDGEMQGFRFYDKKFVIDGNKIYEVEDLNYSNWIFFGKRVSLDEFKAQYGNDYNYGILISNIESSNYKYVCYTQVGSILPMKKGDMTFDEYVIQRKQEQEKELKAREMFCKLREHIGEEVSYTVFRYGIKNETTDKLLKINDFINVEFNYSVIPFIGNEVMIVDIKSKTGELLYFNSNAKPYYERITDKEIFEEQRLIFGNLIVDELVAQKEKHDREFVELEKKKNNEAKKSKYTFMKEGLTLINPEKVEEWLQFVDNNCKDDYSTYTIKAVISMMKKLDSGVSFAEAEKQVYCDELNLSGNGLGLAANALSHFAKQGEEYKKYRSSINGVENYLKNSAINLLNLNGNRKIKRKNIK